MRMKKVSSLLVAGLTLAVGTMVLQAQVYSDSADFAQYPNGATVGNLYLTSGAPMLADTGDGTTAWRYRDTGPGVPSWNGNSYQISYADGDVSGYQAITGLTPNQMYSVAIYGVYPFDPSSTAVGGSSARRGLDVSLNGGSTYSTVDNKGANVIHWVDNSTALGAAITPDTKADTRFWSWVPGTAMSDGSGNLDIYVQIPAMLSDGEANDRFVLDGFALTAGVVPEPTTLALAGLGATMLMLIRRRRH